MGTVRVGLSWTAAALLALIIMSCGDDKGTGSKPRGTWQLMLGDQLGDVGVDIVRSNDNSYFVLGSWNAWTMDRQFGPADIYIIKIDGSGELLRSKRFGGDGADFGFSLAPAEDGGCVILAAGDNESSNYYQLLLRIEADGDSLWQRDFRISGELDDVTLAADGGYYIAGFDHLAPSASQAILGKVSITGSLLWWKTFGTDENDRAWTVAGTVDGGCYVGGYSGTEFLDVGHVPYVAKVDGQGGVLWQASDSAVGRGTIEGMLVMSNGSCIAVGNIDPPGADSADILLMEIDQLGIIRWEKIIHHDGFEYANNIAHILGQGFVIVGSTGWSLDEADLLLIKTDLEGNTIWSRTHGGSGFDSGYGVALADDGGFIVAGVTSLQGIEHGDVWILKVDANGRL